MTGMANRIRLAATVLLLSGTVGTVAGMTLTPANPAYPNEIGVGVSYGFKFDKDAEFWGYAPDYVRTFGQKWILNLSLAYDEETEKKDGADSVVETWTPSLMLGYQVSNRVALGGGVGHGLYENKGEGGWQSVSFGDDVSAALAVAVTLWSKDRHGVSLSVSLEHSISDNEQSVSTDIGYGFGF